jgi:aminoglycoside 3-N-acetyltransferase
MPIAETTQQKFAEHLKELGVADGDQILVHSRLLSFGLIEGGVEVVYKTLRKAVGTMGTIAVPNYIFDINGKRNYDYDPACTPSPLMGALSEYIRELPDAHRSRSPIHNHSVVGKNVGIVNKMTGEASFGEKSDFHLFYTAGFSLLLLGCSFCEGASYVHHVETMCRVPYRRWVEVPRRIMDSTGGFENVLCHYYDRIDRGYRENFDVIGDKMQEEQKLVGASCPYGNSYYMRLSDLHDCVRRMIEKDPYAVVKKPESV